MHHMGRLREANRVLMSIVAKARSEPKPPKAVGYAVEIGVVAVAASMLRGPGGAVLRVVNMVFAAIILYGIYRMRRWAVWSYLVLTGITVATAVATYGLGAWRG